MEAVSVSGSSRGGTSLKGFKRLKLFFALSRTPHGLVDMATPGLAALLGLGAFPPPLTIALGFMTVFAGYTAVYALNDVVDFRADKEKLKQSRSKDYWIFLPSDTPLFQSSQP